MTESQKIDLIQLENKLRKSKIVYGIYDRRNEVENEPVDINDLAFIQQLFQQYPELLEFIPNNFRIKNKKEMFLPDINVDLSRFKQIFGELEINDSIMLANVITRYLKSKNITKLTSDIEITLNEYGIRSISINGINNDESYFVDFSKHLAFTLNDIEFLLNKYEVHSTLKCTFNIIRPKKIILTKNTCNNLYPIELLTYFIEKIPIANTQMYSLQLNDLPSVTIIKNMNLNQFKELITKYYRCILPKLYSYINLNEFVIEKNKIIIKIQENILSLIKSIHIDGCTTDIEKLESLFLLSRSLFQGIPDDGEIYNETYLLTEKKIKKFIGL